jgi:hypothetical protein
LQQPFHREHYFELLFKASIEFQQKISSEDRSLQKCVTIGNKNTIPTDGPPRSFVHRVKRDYDKNVKLRKMYPLILFCLRRDRHQQVLLAEHLSPANETRAFLGSIAWENLLYIKKTQSATLHILLDHPHDHSTLHQ